MTNKDALVAVLQVEVPPNSLAKVLLDNGIADTDDYDPAIMQKIDLCAIEILIGMMAAPTVSEGGFSIQFDGRSVTARIDALCSKNGVDNPLRAKVKSVSPW